MGNINPRISQNRKVWYYFRVLFQQRRLDPHISKFGQPSSSGDGKSTNRKETRKRNETYKQHHKRAWTNTWSKLIESSHLCLCRFSGAVILRGSGFLHACAGQSGKGTVSMAPSWAASRTLEYLWRWFPEKGQRKVMREILTLISRETRDQARKLL